MKINQTADLPKAARLGFILGGIFASFGASIFLWIEPLDLGGMQVLAEAFLFIPFVFGLLGVFIGIYGKGWR